MRICDLLNCPAGTRIRVTKVADSEAERLGYVTDVDVLTGRTGVVIKFSGGTIKQLEVSWDEPGTTLMLAGLDEIEVVTNA